MSELTWRQLWQQTAIELGRPQSRWLCETASGLEGDEFIAHLDTPATQRMVVHLDAMLARVAAGEPLQYVLGHWGFRHLDLLIDRRVLIPRPETEQVVDVALRVLAHVAPTRLCADLGTGSGAIGLSLASELPLMGTTVWLTDVVAEALDVARANTAGIGRAAANIRIAHGDWCSALPNELVGQFDLLVSNPPYIAVDDPAVEAIVRDWEPHHALYAGVDGLTHVRVIARQAISWLRPGGSLVLEIGTGQGTQVSDVLAGAGFCDVEVVADLAGHDRIASARRP